MPKWTCNTVSRTCESAGVFRNARLLWVHLLIYSYLMLLLRIICHFAGPGGKAGTFGVASNQQEAIERRERLRKLALETIDLQKDPYFMRNHLGQYECKLCLTLHPNEGNYLAHTQGKRHQQNLARRQAKDAAQAAIQPAPAVPVGPKKRGIKIGRPGYKVVKQFDPERQQRSLLFEIQYPEIEEGLQPRHRFMSAYEQRMEAPDKDWQ